MSLVTDGSALSILVGNGVEALQEGTSNPQEATW